MSSLVLLRHGISYTNEGRHVDHESENLLSRTGVQQVLMHAENFRAEHPDLHFHHAFISPFQRAVQTGLNFLSTFENGPVTFEYEERLTERKFGFEKFIGFKQLIDDHGQEVVDSWDQEVDKKPHPMGETQQDVYNRTVQAFGEQVFPRLAHGENILIVTHYYVIKALMSHFHSDDAHSMRLFNPRNCIPYTYHFDEFEFKVAHVQPFEVFDHYAKI